MGSNTGYYNKLGGEYLQKGIDLNFPACSKPSCRVGLPTTSTRASSCLASASAMMVRPMGPGPARWRAPAASSHHDMRLCYEGVSSKRKGHVPFGARADAAISLRGVSFDSKQPFAAAHYSTAKDSLDHPVGSGALTNGCRSGVVAQ
jgi:hypothetical protein